MNYGLSLYTMLKDTWQNPFELSNEGLCSISTASVLSTKAVQDKGSELKAGKNLFLTMTIVAQTRQLDMKKVFSYPLGQFPWSLSTSRGSLRKTSKSVLSQALEKLTESVENLPEGVMIVVDAMSVAQRIKGDHKTFGEVSKFIFRRILAEAKESTRVDVVFDVYRDISIKNIERSEKRCSSLAPTFKSILPTHRIQQWSNFLKGNDNKCAFIRFLAEEWRKETYRSTLAAKEMYISQDEICLRIA